MVDADAVRRVGRALPRSYEAFIGRRWKLKVRQLVYVAFSRDESAMGFGYPRDARDSLIESDPETFCLPPTADLRYQWVCAHLARLDDGEMRELVTDAARRGGGPGRAGLPLVSQSESPGSGRWLKSPA